MCGIAGIVRRDALGADDLEVVRAMTTALRHRGPDGEGALTLGRAALGHRRLAVVDLSPRAAQPMRPLPDVEGGPVPEVAITYNGEVYNFADLRAELEELGYRFASRSDTEVVLQGWRAWGERLPERLNGMFALAVWDQAAGTLFLARDRYGEKPLFYRRLEGGGLAFASEVRSLLLVPGAPRALDPLAVAKYLAFDCVPGEGSVFQGVRKLRPGHALVWRGGEVRSRRYWERRYGHSRVSPEEAEDRVWELLVASVERRLMSDVPLGVFLSGGLDSSAVLAAMAARVDPTRIEAFTVGFEEASFDESPWARAVAKRFGVRHHERTLSPAELLRHLPEVLDPLDEPLADASLIPTYALAKLARERVTVALGGDGGDELFAGYNRYLLADRLWRRLKAVPSPLRRLAARGLLAVDAGTWNRVGGALQHWRAPARRHALVGAKLHKFARSVLPAASLNDMHRSLASQWPDPARLVAGGHEPPTAFDAAAPSGVDDPIDRMCLLDQRLYMPDDILVKVDRAAMAVALETRVPLLDHRVVEFAWRLPARFKLRDGQGKWLLRQVLYRHVPAALIERPKQGFAVPLQAWLQGPLRDWAEDLLAPERLRGDGFIDPVPVRAAWASFLRGDDQWGGALWAVLMWQAWRAEEKRR